MSFFSIFKDLFFKGKSDNSSDQPLFDGDVKEIAVRLALSGNGLENEQERIEEFYKNKISPFETKLKGEEQLYNELIDQTKDIIAAQKEVKQKNEDEIVKTENDQKNSYESLIGEQINNNNAWNIILSHRFKQGKEFFSEQRDRIISTLNEDWDQIKDTILKQFDIEREIHNIQVENYEINKEELNRRAKKLEAVSDKVELQMEKAGKQIESLKTFGITRTVATFLLIAGIVSLAGAGTVVANLLQDRTPGDDLITWMVKGFGNFFTDSFGTAPAYAKPGIIIASILGFLLIFYGVISISNWLVKKFDKSLDSEMGEPKPDSRDSDTANKDKSKSSDKKRKRLQINLENFIQNYQGIKSYFDFIPLNIERKDYSQLIASFPYIFLVAVIIFLLSTGSNLGANGSNLLISDFKLSTAYIGIIVVLLATSCCIIYVTKVIEPRWLNYLEQKNNPNTSPQSRIGFILLNKEILMLVILLIFSLVLASLMPVKSFGEFWTPTGGWDIKDSVFKHLVWGSLAIFVTLSSLGLAYGIVYQGIFHEFDYLNYKSQVLRELIEKYYSKPVLGSSRFFQYNYPNDLLADNINRLHDLEDNKARYEMFEIFGDDYEFKTSPSDGSSFIVDLVGKVFSSQSPKEAGKRELRYSDYIHDSDAAKDFLNSVDKINSINKTISTNREKIAVLKDEIVTAEEKQKKSELELVDLMRKKTESVSEIQKSINELKEAKEKDLMIFTAAYTIGSVANKLLKEEDILASEIIHFSNSKNPDDFSSTVIRNLPFPFEAYWRRTSSKVQVTAYHGIIDNRHWFSIDKSESIIPEDELLFIKQEV